VRPNNSFKPTPHRGVGHVPALRWHASANKVACTKIVRASTGFDLAEGKKVTDGVLDGEIQHISVASHEDANRLAQALIEIGAIASVVAAADDN
jgi:ribosomal protein L7/L12